MAAAGAAFARASASSRMVSAGTSHTPSAHSGVQGAISAANSSKPTEWFSTKSWS